MKKNIEKIIIIVYCIFLTIFFVYLLSEVEKIKANETQKQRLISNISQAINNTEVKTNTNTKTNTKTEIKNINETVRTITAYNLGIVEQTDSSPCVGATNKDLCKLLSEGIKICAANFVPLYTKLRIEKFGDCIVMDRMAKRYKNAVDVAFPKIQIKEAKKFGRQMLKVYIY
jgi:3D (Asp-Asp-Asp) domain-containing protein